ncbi:hypothetical protein FQV37_2151 [Psychrobacter nivimaris]|uniref:Uncharacterized protein n=1 Tax=Psychrobacter nivimaris TaxID=281738 RepID=A0A6N7BTY0_9GAMM|nr:hypothetical protein FQV37_2151 [Psychrobacter nivimaris]
MQFWLYYKYYQKDIKSKDFDAKNPTGYFLGFQISAIRADYQAK